MKRGSLVVTKSRWGIVSRQLGLVVTPGNIKGVWVVLWTGKFSCKLQEHLEGALLELNIDDEVECKNVH